MGAVALEAFRGFHQNVANVFDMDDRPVGAQSLDESAHVCSLEMVRQVNRELNSGHRALDRMVLIANLHRVAEGFYSNPVNRQPAFVAFTLSVFQHGSRIFSECPRHRKPKKPCGYEKFGFY